MSPQESSLAMAREFLSRLLLMLACFVVLCLLLFKFLLVGSFRTGIDLVIVY